MEEKKTGKVHGLTIKERKYGKLTGVQDIHSFNENEILLQTEAGKVQIKGEQLHVKSLDLEKGEAEIEGKVNSVSYLTKNAQKKEEPLLKGCSGKMSSYIRLEILLFFALSKQE